MNSVLLTYGWEPYAMFLGVAVVLFVLCSKRLALASLAVDRDYVRRMQLKAQKARVARRQPLRQKLANRRGA